MTKKLYLESSSTTEQAKVIETINEGDKVIVRLDRTIFHPQGGGQKADRGTINGEQVLHVAKNGVDGVDHILSSSTNLSIGDGVNLVVDKGFRELNAGYHTAGHLIGSVIEELFPGVKAKFGHQWPGEARVEFEGIPADLDKNRDEYKELVQNRLNSVVDSKAGVRVIDSSEGRAIAIGEYPPMGCGGTHVASLREIASIEVAALKQKKGMLRVSYEAFLS